MAPALTPSDATRNLSTVAQEIFTGIVRGDGESADLARQVAVWQGPTSKTLALRGRLTHGQHRPETAPPRLTVESAASVVGFDFASDDVLSANAPYAPGPVFVRWECEEPEATKYWRVRVWLGGPVPSG